MAYTKEQVNCRTLLVKASDSIPKHSTELITEIVATVVVLDFVVVVVFEGFWKPVCQYQDELFAGFRLQPSS